MEYCEKYRQYQEEQFAGDRSWRQHQEQQFAGDRSRRRSQSKPEIKSKEFENKQNTSCKDEFSSTKTDKAWSDWRKTRAFKADQTINQQFFSAPLPEPGTLSFYKSGLGTGKTHQVVQFVESLKDEGWLAISYRNSILLQFCAKSPNFYHLQTELKGKEDEILIRDPHSKIALCIESIIHFKPDEFDDKNVIIDEIESTIDSLFRSDTSVGFYRQKAKELFAEILNRAKRVICLDGNLSNLTVNYLKSLLKEPKKLVIIENEYKGNRGKVEFYEGSEDTNGRKYLSDKSCVIEAILNNPNCFAVGSDSRNAVEALDKLLQAKGGKGFRLDSTTINQSWAKKFLNDPKDFILKHQPQYFLYSPSAEAGIDINIQGYFSDIYFLFFGVLYTNKQLQMLGRIRDYLAKIHVFSTYTGIEAYSLSNSPFLEKVEEAIISYVLEDAAASLEDAEPRQKVLEVAHQLVALSIDPHFKHECQLISLGNHEKVNLRACLKEALISSGYDVELVKGFKANLKTYNDAKDSVIDQACIDIYQAKNISTSEADKKSSDFGLTWKEKCEISQRRLLDRLPGIENAVIKTIIREPIEQFANLNLTDSQKSDILNNANQMPCSNGKATCLDSFPDVSNFNSEVKQPEITQNGSNPEKIITDSPSNNNDVQMVEREVYINVLRADLIRKLALPYISL